MSFITNPQNANVAYDQKNFAIDSAQRSAGTRISNFRHQTPLPRDYDFDRVTCLQAEIPKAYLMLDSAATFELNEATGSVDTIVTIPGALNYTVAELTTALATALTAASATGANSFTYTVTFSASSGRFTITASAGEFTLTFNETSEDNKVISKYLGFDKGALSDSSASSILISKNIIDLQRHNVLYIRSNISNNAGDDILAAIYVGSSIDLSMIRWNTPDGRLYSVGLNSNVASCSTFSLTDAQNKEIEMNGVNWRFTFQAFKSQRIL